MPYPYLDPRSIRVHPLAERNSKTAIRETALDPDLPPAPAPQLQPLVHELAERILAARAHGASVMLAFGAHLIKNGASPVVIRMLEEGWLTHLATNGAGSIHDWEFAFQGRSEEDVRANVAQGRFGTWDETGRHIHLAVQVNSLRGMGYGESVGAMVMEDGLLLPVPEALEKALQQSLRENHPLAPAQAELLGTMRTFGLGGGPLAIAHPCKPYSLCGQAFRLGIPLTVHCGIGYDIIYNHPYANGAALGRASHLDFKIFARSVAGLEHGVFLSVGSAIMAPQIFEKALSAVNNLRLQERQPVLSGHLMVINDLQESHWDWSQGEPPKSSPDYYLRFLKSFYRMGGSVRYVAADNRLFLHHLYTALREKKSV
ncbi:MAG TPA: hypothetical protein PKI62_02935 [bacterium]|nr:hypothetical protein [bacterium]HPR88110.1 hypothetical protein [bacterium]HPR88889.1 hypothetical protein [bacterium]